MDSSDEESEEGQINLGTYEGRRNSKNERDGAGKASLPNGDTYEGSYSKGKRHGEGTYTFTSGAQYVGNYVFGKKEGYGEFHYPDKSRYEGTWSNDARHGNGIFYYVNGDRYEGEWLHNKRHGQGVYYYVDGTVYEGQWESGKRHGAGEHVNKDHRFIGSYKSGLPCGEGRYLFNKGYEQNGYYVIEEIGMGTKNNKQDGSPMLDEHLDFNEDIIKKANWMPTTLTAIPIPST